MQTEDYNLTYPFLWSKVTDKLVNASLPLGYNVGNEISVNAQCEEYIVSL